MNFSMFEKLGFAAIVTAWVVWGVNWIGDALIHVEPLKVSAVKIEGGNEKPTEKAAEEPAPAPADALAMLAAADAAAGKKVFRKCAICHTTNKGGKNRVGPNLWDVVGRAKAGGEGYKYSSALKSLGGEWTYQDMDAFLAAPKVFAKGTKMRFAGVRKASDRAALMVFLRAFSDQPKPLP